jgi:hypothetical protein
MPDWNTRLEVKLGDATITPISSTSGHGIGPSRWIRSLSEPSLIRSMTM